MRHWRRARHFACERRASSLSRGSGLALLLVLTGCGALDSEQAPSRAVGEERALNDARAMLEKRRNAAGSLATKARTTDIRAAHAQNADQALVEP